MKAAYAAKENFEGREIVKAGELVDVRFIKGQSPTLAARRTLALLIGVSAGDAWLDTRHRITKRELRQGHKGNERLPDLLDEIAGIRLKIETLSSRGRHAIERAGLFARLVEESDEGGDSIIEWEFSPSARSLFGASDHYAALNRAALFAFRSKYTVTFYELGCLLSGRRNPSWRGDIEKLRATLGIEPKKLKRWPDLRRFVLEVAQEEINHLAHFTLTWKEVRQRRKVVGIELFFWRKGAEETDAAADELARAKPGRKARRKGLVETVSPALELPSPPPDDEIIS